MRRWWDALRHSDPHIQLLVAVLALPLALVVIAALGFLLRAVLRAGGGG